MPGEGGIGLICTYGLGCDHNSNNITLCGTRGMLVASMGYVGGTAS